MKINRTKRTVAIKAIENAARTELRKLPKPDYTHEACRYCHGDDAWSNWQPCTTAQARIYEGREDFRVRPLTGETS